MNRVQSLAIMCQSRHMLLEDRYSITAITNVSHILPSGCIESAIKHYQGIIRSNPWYFPTLKDVSVDVFLHRWNEVHASYFELAEEIFSRLSKSQSTDSLVDADLLERVIHSETMRGWVGKRSPSGLDALLNNKAELLEELLQDHFDFEELDELLSVGGVCSDITFVSAETEMQRLFGQYRREHGDTNLTTEALGQFSNADVPVIILREFCRYSIEEFNKKLSAFSRTLDVCNTETDSQEWVASKLEKLSGDTFNSAIKLFKEIQVLNYLNLNLEVKYSFKGWAGLMHVVVFTACSNTTNIPSNVYAIHTKLKK